MREVTGTLFLAGDKIIQFAPGFSQFLDSCQVFDDHASPVDFAGLPSFALASQAATEDKAVWLGKVTWIQCRGGGPPSLSLRRGGVVIENTLPGWRNGRRGGFKIRCPQGHGGSSPPLGTKYFNGLMGFEALKEKT